MYGCGARLEKESGLREPLLGSREVGHLAIDALILRRDFVLW